MFHDNMYGHMPKRRPLATASLVLGILSLVLCSVIYLALPLGSLAVLFAIMSHTEYTMTGKSKAGLICGLCGILATIAVTVSAFRFVLTNPEAKAYLDAYIQMYTGDETLTIEELFQELLPGVSEPDSGMTEPGNTAPEIEDLPLEVLQEGGTFL